MKWWTGLLIGLCVGLSVFLLSDRHADIEEKVEREIRKAYESRQDSLQSIIDAAQREKLELMKKDSLISLKIADKEKVYDSIKSVIKIKDENIRKIRNQVSYYHPDEYDSILKYILSRPDPFTEVRINSTSSDL
jgi:Mg2+ and Co2+ transporter CorA